MSTMQMLALIQEYLSSARAAADLLRKTLGADDLLRARRLGAFPGEGWIDREGLIRYSFHGVGCTVQSGGQIIDFDFGPGGSVDGFDLWRLRRFLDSGGKDYPDLGTIEQQELAFTSLIEQGEIVKSDELPSPHLFRLRDADLSAG